MGHTRIARAQYNHRSLAETRTKNPAIGIKSDNRGRVSFAPNSITAGKNFLNDIGFWGCPEGGDQILPGIQVPAG